MKSPALRRSAFARAVFAIILTCVLITQPLFGAGVPALAEPTEPKVSIALERLTEDKLPTGSENKYAVTVTCEYMDASVSDKCLDAGEIYINGMPEGWSFKKPAELATNLVQSSDPQLLKTIDGGTQGKTWTYEFVVIPPNHTTPNNTSWELTATLKSKAHEEGLDSNAVPTRAAADKQFSVMKKAVKKSTWPGDTLTWVISVNPFKSNKYAHGTLIPTTIEYRDVLPEGLELKGMRNAGQPFADYTFNEDTRELTWEYSTDKFWTYFEDYSNFEIVTEVNSDIPAGKHVNRVTATATYREGDGSTSTIEKSSEDEVATAPQPEGTGVIEKRTFGTKYRRGASDIRYADGILRRSYEDARDSDWINKRLQHVIDTHRNQTSSSHSGGNPLVEGAYEVSLTPLQGGDTLDYGSPLYPLTLRYQDDVPCMDYGFVDDGYLYKSRTDGNLCQKPAFHVTAVEIDVADFYENPHSIDVGDFKPLAVLADGKQVELERLGQTSWTIGGTEYTRSVVFSVPQHARGRVSRIVADPKGPLKKANNWKMTIGGFAEESLPSGAILHNEKAQVKAWGNGVEKPIVDGTSLSADLHVLGSLHNVQTTGNAYSGKVLRVPEGGSEASRRITTEKISFTYRGPKKDSGHIVVSSLLPRDVLPVTDISEFEMDNQPNRNLLNELKTVTFDRGVTGDVSRTVEPEIIENFRDGRTLVRWKIPHEWFAEDQSGYADIKGDLSIPRQVLHYGMFYSNLYLTDRTEPNLRCMYRMGADTYDIDDNPATTDACQDSSSLSWEAPTGYRTLTLAKAVKGPKEDSFAYSPKRAEVGEGDGDVTYRVEAINSSSDAMSKVVVYDVLPYKGDTGVSSNLADTPRGSTMSGKFTGVEDNIPEGVTVFYSTSTNPCRPEVLPNAKNSGCENNWSSKAPDDLGSVKALKFVYEGELGQGKSLTIDYKMSVPEMGPKDVLWNSVAAKASFANGESLPAIEAPKVGAARVAEPQFAVEKKPGEATAENGEWSSTYTVTVTNTGPFEGAIPRVTDTPVLPDGFEFNKVLVDGADTNYKNDAFPVTQGEKIAPGASKSFKVVISGTYEAAEVDWAAVASCEAGDGSGAGGLVNRVTMDGDTDGTENNTACNPVKKDPKFAVKKEASGEASAVNGKWSSTYKVTVSNTGEVKGTSKAVMDTPSVPAGFTLSGAKVDGKGATLKDGSFTVTDGVELALGESKTFEVVLSGAFDPARVKESEVLHCTGKEGSSDGKGFANGVTMGGDSDGDGNNTACTTVEKTPHFAVKKDAVGEASAVNGKWSSTYSVTVTNTGAVNGTSKAVTDKPSAPAGFQVGNVSVDGADASLEDGSVTVTEGVELAPGESKSFTVVVSGSYRPADVDWTAAGQCGADDAEGAHGFVNTVAMPGDTDGEDNNTACTTVEKDPAFAVKKESGKASAVNGEWSSTYTVTVANTGERAGKSKPVVDTPRVPAGFTVTGATVEGKRVAVKDGSFTVTDGVELGLGGAKSFTVVVSGSYSANADWAKASRCDADGTTSGLFNQVSMPGDSDGAANNTACNTVEKPKTPVVPQKPSKPQKPVSGLPLPRTGAPIGLSAAAGVFTVLAGCVILVAGRRSRRS